MTCATVIGSAGVAIANAAARQQQAPPAPDDQPPPCSKCGAAMPRDQERCTACGAVTIVSHAHQKQLR
jgi:hypothetical protein